MDSAAEVGKQSEEIATAERECEDVAPAATTGDATPPPDDGVAATNTGIPVLADISKAGVTDAAEALAAARAAASQGDPRDDYIPAVRLRHPALVAAAQTAS